MIPWVQRWYSDCNGCLTPVLSRSARPVRLPVRTRRATPPHRPTTSSAPCTFDQPWSDHRLQSLSVARATWTGKRSVGAVYPSSALAPCLGTLDRNTPQVGHRTCLKRVLDSCYPLLCTLALDPDDDSELRLEGYYRLVYLRCRGFFHFASACERGVAHSALITPVTRVTTL